MIQSNAAAGSQLLAQEPHAAQGAKCATKSASPQRCSTQNESSTAVGRRAFSLEKQGRLLAERWAAAADPRPPVPCLRGIPGDLIAVLAHQNALARRSLSKTWTAQRASPDRRRTPETDPKGAVGLRHKTLTP